MKKLYLIVIVLLLLPAEAICCTTAIFSGKVTKDGRPIIWKNRDSGYMQNRVDYVPAGDDIKYGFLFISNSTDKKEAWSGLNSAGFSIMNSVSYNIRRKGDDTPDSMMDREGIIMYNALATCATLQEFEYLLDNLETPWGIEANFGVIDAYGGAAFYEVNNYEWVKYDINDPEVAPDGYMIRSNYSFSGREGEGKGYVRYNNALHNISSYIQSSGKIDVRWVMDKLSRSYYQWEKGHDPYKEGSPFFIDKDFIPRRSTCSVSIAKGVKKGEDPALAEFWCALGYPPVSQIVPLMVSAGVYIPKDITAKNRLLNSAACNRSLKRKATVFSPKRADDQYYIDLDKVREYMKEISAAEDQMYEDWKNIDKTSAAVLKDFYENLKIL